MYEPYNNEYYNQEPLEPVQPVVQPKKKRTWLKVTALCLCCTLLGGAVGLGGAMAFSRFAPGENAASGSGSSVQAPAEQKAPAEQQEPAGQQPENPAAAVPAVNDSNAVQLTPAQVYAANVDACVGITVSTTTNVFGYTTTAAATGSGFVISPDGYVVTNHHVIEEATQSANVPITVSFQNGKSYEARLVGSEAENDVAVLKIEATELPCVTLGDSDKLVVGEPVYAIGNPLGELTFTLTDGLVSALDRIITTGSGNSAVSMNMLQTNCAINSGNSGGPLFNSRGEVIGITTAKMSGSSSSSATIEGLGFAIPINDVKRIIADLAQHGYVTGKPYMGVQVSSVTETDAKRYGLKVGAYVDLVEEDSSAAKAGLQVGDIIIAIDDKEINSHSALVATVGTYRAGDTVVLTVMRDREELKLTVVLGEKQAAQPEQEAVPEQDQRPGQQPGNGGQSGGRNDRGSEFYYQWPFSEFFGFPF